MSLTHSANNNCLFCVLTRPITYQNKLLLLYSCVLKSRFLAPLDITDISGYQLGIGCQFVQAHNNGNPATNKKIFQIRFVSNLDICKIVIVCPGQHHVKTQVWNFEIVSKTQIKAK